MMAKRRELSREPDVLWFSREQASAILRQTRTHTVRVGSMPWIEVGQTLHAMRHEGIPVHFADLKVIEVVRKPLGNMDKILFEGASTGLLEFRATHRAVIGAVIRFQLSELPPGPSVDASKRPEGRLRAIGLQHQIAELGRGHGLPDD
jgi:hypothetical protein